MKKKGQAIVGVIVTVIISAIMLAVLWNFSQGSSGNLRIENEVVDVAANDTFYDLDYTAVSVDDVTCSGVSLTVKTDYSLNGGDQDEGSKIKLHSNRTGGTDCDETWGGSGKNIDVDYDYRNALYISNALARTPLSYIAVAFALIIVMMAFVGFKNR